MRKVLSALVAVSLLTGAFSKPSWAQAPYATGGRVVPDSHNCYPYEGRWNDRIDRALAGGLPVAIEQDLIWDTPPKGGVAQSLVYDDLAVGARVLTFGAVHTNQRDLRAAPSVMETDAATNYRRWWNNPWEVVEPEGQAKAGAWAEVADRRLKALVTQAHQRGLWIRFYTLDGTSREELKRNGWSGHYNFSSPALVQARWKAAAEAGVDFIATDEYERLSFFINKLRM